MTCLKDMFWFPPGSVRGLGEFRLPVIAVRPASDSRAQIMGRTRSGSHSHGTNVAHFHRQQRWGVRMFSPRHIRIAAAVMGALLPSPVLALDEFRFGTS